MPASQFKSITPSNQSTRSAFEVDISDDGKGVYSANVNPRSVIYKSLNLKDMMIYTGYIDEATKSLITSTEGNLSGHAINGLDSKINLDKTKENHIIYLEVGIGPSLYATGASIKISDLTNPWSGYPESIIYNPPLEFDKEGNLKSSVIYRRQTAAIFPLAYLTNDTTQPGKTVMIKKSETDKEPKVYKLVQTINYNILMTTFNYDGNPVAYGVPFMNPFLWYSSSSSS
jgi:hypothetical protein